MTKPHQRSDLCRSVPFTSGDDDGHGDGRTFRGYGAVFNRPTRIDSWEGRFDEQFAPGAFRKTLRERTPKFQFDHGRHPLIGSVPIGTITTISEDDRGLDVEARLGKHMLIDLIQEALETGAIDGMSIRFTVVREEWRDRNGQVVAADEVDELLWETRRDDGDRGPLLRTIQEAKLDEVGPVVWPAYADTTAGVRSAEPVTIDPTRLHEPTQRRALAELLIRADAQDQTAPAGAASSDDEPQDTTEVDVEHSEEDTDPPRDTTEDVEHEPESNTEPPPTDPVDKVRAAEIDLLYARALAEVRTTRESTPPMEGL
ncbi:HK97 family phage prohead protease [Gordonia sp. PP30]|uniref:HK97 family phage prohead protease n=1 Tax=Gordonia sp. PP30 TaxID=2935861 RepID=UPI0020002590|nr:HK97 family phage prohead protease [Gordonia sp. PP30]UQE74199.1 HK97 family phage prohead protease [Gordonia sp. PP30]